MLGPQGETFLGHFQRHSKASFLKKMKSPTPQPQFNAALLRVSSWFIDNASPWLNVLEAGDFFNPSILWTLNHETQRGERHGDLMTANKQDRQGGTVSPRHLSVGRFCSIRDHAPHPIKVMCSLLHGEQHKTTAMCSLVCLRCFLSPSSLHWSLSVCSSVCVCVSLLHSQSVKRFTW